MSAKLIVEITGLKAFAGHAGRPGEVGGSALRSNIKAYTGPRKGRQGKVGGSMPRKAGVNAAEPSKSKSVNVKKALDEYKNLHKSSVFGGDAALSKQVQVASKRTGINSKDISHLIDEWNYSSNGSDQSCLLQKSALALGAKLSEWQEKQFGMYDDSGAKLSGKQCSILLKQAYDDTQKELGRKGFKPNDTITLYRGVYTKGSTTSYSANALESWTFDKSIAEGFAGHSKSIAGLLGLQKPGSLIKTNIRVKDIVSIGGKSWFGEPGQNEVVVMGRGKRNVSFVPYHGVKELSDDNEDDDREASEDWLVLYRMYISTKAGRKGGTGSGNFCD